MNRQLIVRVSGGPTPSAKARLWISLFVLLLALIAAELRLISPLVLLSFSIVFIATTLALYRRDRRRPVAWVAWTCLSCGRAHRWAWPGARLVIGEHLLLRCEGCSC